MTSTSPTDRLSPLDPLPAGCRLVRATGRLQRRALAEIIAPGRSDGGEAVGGFIDYAALRGLDLSHIWVVLNQPQHILAAALAIPSPGRVAMLFASRPGGAAGRRHVAAAIDAVVQHLPEVDLAQAILEVDEREYAAAYELAGFQRLGVLSYQELRLAARPPAARHDWPAGVELHSYAEFDAAEADRLFCEGLDASYEATLDCPLLRGIRRTSDVLVGHKATGDFDPELWTLVLRDGRPQGALLLSLLPERGSHELVYLGVSPQVRGEGVGRALLEHGVRQIVARRGKLLTLAVDEANEPALRLYRKLGFRATERRLALIRDIGSPS